MLLILKMSGVSKSKKTLAAEFMADIGRYRGVDAVDGRIRDWLGKELDV